MAFKIKDNLDLYGNQLLNFALQSDSGFPQSPQVGHMFNYTGTGVMANHAVMCVDETTKAFKALAFVDEIATNEAFTELAGKVEDIEKALGTDSKDVLDTWAEVQDFLKNINENDADLMTMLNSKLDKSGGTIEGGRSVYTPLAIKNTNLLEVWIKFQDAKGICNIGSSNGVPSVNTGGENLTILHQGNIGEYALKIDGSNVMTSYITLTTDGTQMLVLKSSTGANRGQLGTDTNNGQLIWRNLQANESWRYVAFTDSTVAAAQKLVTSAGADAVTIDSSKNAIFESNIYLGNEKPIYMKDKGGNHRVALYLAAENILWTGYNNGADVESRIAGSKVALCYGASRTQGLILNSSGNVTIGGSDLAGTDVKLHVADTRELNGYLPIGRFLSPNLLAGGTSVIIFGKSESTKNRAYIGYAHNSDGSDNNAITFGFYGKDKLVNFLANGNVLIGTPNDNNTGARLQVDGGISLGNQADSELLFQRPYYNRFVASKEGGFFAWRVNGRDDDVMVLSNGGSLLIGTPNELKSGAKLQVKGDLYVDGNIIATKEVSAGGAGQEGESGDGGAEVISQPLAKGQSTYTITNTIKRSDIAVSLYEANVINGQTIWSLCLADIEVTNDTITVTFGSATSVNHKLVAVG